jgi:late competence protein required for DNA uptake (superfamily II DNA/RNA helicase)
MPCEADEAVWVLTISVRQLVKHCHKISLPARFHHPLLEKLSPLNKDKFQKFKDRKKLSNKLSE